MISYLHQTIYMHTDDGLLTPRPYTLRLSITFFPPSKVSLHKSVEIMSCRLNQGGIIVNIVPKLALFLVRPFSPSYNNTTIWSWVQVVNVVCSIAQVVCV